MKSIKSKSPAEEPLCVSVGHSWEVGQVMLMFGDPEADHQFVTFLPAQAREIANALLSAARLAEGQRPAVGLPKVVM
jgi:hypothetical protein